MTRRTLADRYEGDPALTLTSEGADLTYRGGQPVMDRGVANGAKIALFTTEGWAGNALLPSAARIGSAFVRRARGPITLGAISLIRQTAEATLDRSPFGEVTATVTNPSGAQIRARIRIAPPANTEQELLLTRNAVNWIEQAGGTGGSDA